MLSVGTFIATANTFMPNSIYVRLTNFVKNTA
jgi:hypothetical protein